MRLSITNAFFYYFFLFLNISCNKNEQENQDCIDNYYQNHPTLIPYTNQQLLCENYVSTIEVKGNLYFYEGSHCADMILRFFDCNNNEASDEIYDCYSFDSSKIIGYYP